jgi:hypothetical protein
MEITLDKAVSSNELRGEACFVSQQTLDAVPTAERDGFAQCKKLPADPIMQLASRKVRVAGLASSPRELLSNKNHLEGLL